MKRVSTIQLIPGMVVAEDVMTLDHHLILAKNSVLTDALITKLELYGVISIYIDDEVPVPSVDPVVETMSPYERIRNSEEFKRFKAEYETEIDYFKGSVNRVIEKNGQFDIKEMLNIPLRLIANARGRLSIFDMLSNMREFDDSTFNHCMNVALICNLFAAWLKFDDADVEMATACGLFHDIGKLFVPREIIQKPGPLTDEEFTQIKRHTVEGYQLLQKSNLDEHICNAALMHHERCDGHGYPLRLKSNQIDMYAKMVSIADVYDAMTSARVYRGPMCPFKVIEIFEAEGLQRYDVNFVLTFLEHVCSSYLQTRCQLNDGRIGTVIFVNKHSLSRPVVMCGNETVDLSKEPSLFIDSLI